MENKEPQRNEKGQFLPGSSAGNRKGRPKGSKNKITKNIKENFEKVFDKMGGVKGFAKFAKKNPRHFYAMYAKMLPTDVYVKKPEFTKFEITFKDDETRKPRTEGPDPSAI